MPDYGTSGMEAAAAPSSSSAAAAAAAAVAPAGKRAGAVDLNVMKRKMTIAKGFLDISLLSANANQLRNILNFGDTTSSAYYIVVTGIIISLILQVASGIILIVAERFDLNDMDHDEWSDIMNTLVICLVFIVLLVNVFISSFGVDVADPVHHLPPSHTNTSHFTPIKNL